MKVFEHEAMQVRAEFAEPLTVEQYAAWWMTFNTHNDPHVSGTAMPAAIRAAATIAVAITWVDANGVAQDGKADPLGMPANLAAWLARQVDTWLAEATEVPKES